MFEELFLLKDLTDCEKESVKSFLSPSVKFKKGEIIYSADNFKNAIGFIFKGKAFAVTNNKQELYMKTFEKGSAFGAAAVFGGGEKYVSSIIAKTDTEVLFINEVTLREIFIKIPKASLNYITFLSDKIRFLNTKLNMLSSKESQDTVYNYLVSSADNNGFVNYPSSMTLLAKMLGLSRATLYRSLDTLVENGKILRENNIIKVQAPQYSKSGHFRAVRFSLQTLGQNCRFGSR